MVYTNLKANSVEKHGIFESSNLKSTDIGNIYDLLVRDAEGTAIDVDNGVAVKVGEYTGDGLQERYATIAAAGDKIAVTGAPALVKEAMTTAQGQPYNFYNKAGFDTKAYELVEDDIFAVADYQFTNKTSTGDPDTTKIKVGEAVVVDGGNWKAQGTGVATTSNGFVGKIHSIAVGDFCSIVRIRVIQNIQK